MPAASTIFDLGNYTIDTGTYEIPHDGIINASGDHLWFSNDKEETYISISYSPPDSSNLSKLSDNEYMAFSVQCALVGTMKGIDYILDPHKSPKTDSFDNLWKNLSPVFVDKPYPGYIAISPNYPTSKAYVGAIDKFNYLTIFSNESDERMAFIMSELKVYPKEESNAARLQAIQKML